MGWLKEQAWSIILTSIVTFPIQMCSRCKKFNNKTCLINQVDHMKFSVLMSIYHKEDAQHFDRAMHSIWDEQTIRPNEIVLVEDGPLSDVLYQSIDQWKEKLGDIIKVTSLKENAGVGNAKHIGIE